MAKGSGGTRGASGGTGGGGGMSARARQLANQYLGDVKNPELKKELAEGLAAFEKEFGIPDYVSVEIKDLGKRAAGWMEKNSGVVAINSRFESNEMSISQARFTMIHELAHSIDSSYVGGKGTTGDVIKRIKFNKELPKLYKSFKSAYGNAETKSVGGYALTNSNEFFAESIAHYITGTRNQYTISAFNLAKSIRS